jgi:hypothetical protein
MNGKPTAIDVYRRDELLDATISGARVVSVDPTTIRVALQVGETTRYVDLPRGTMQIAISRVAPAEWPPMPGDLWRDRVGSLWFCRLNGGIEMTPADVALTAWIRPDDLLRRSPLTLVYREPEPVWCVSCEQDGHTEDDCPRNVRQILTGPGADHYAACQAERFAGPHTYTGTREVGPNWEVCGRPIGDPIHQLASDEDVEGGEQA